MAPRDHAGGPWEQQDGLEMVVYKILFDFGVILGPVYISFLSSRTPKFRFFFSGGFLGLEDRLEHRGIFVMQTDPEKLNCGVFGPPTDIKG